MKDPILIRTAREEDAENIALVERLSFPVPWSREAILHDLTENALALVLVAEYEGRFAGYADVWCIAGEGQLNNIAVMPEMRGLAVGESLMRELFCRLAEREVAEISLEVRVGNRIARGLYDKLGFVVRGQRKHYYEDNKEDALILARAIVREDASGKTHHFGN